jgi:hypothetical protein
MCNLQHFSALCGEVRGGAEWAAAGERSGGGGGDNGEADGGGDGGGEDGGGGADGGGGDGGDGDSGGGDGGEGCGDGGDQRATGNGPKPRRNSAAIGQGDLCGSGPGAPGPR